MTERISDFNAHIGAEAKRILAAAPARVVLLHHNDADGLTAGAILTAAFERLHTPLLRYCLEKPYPVVLDAIFDNPFLDKESVFVFADFGSGMLPTIARLNHGRFKILVLDHHIIEPTEDENIVLLNPRSSELDGNTECSASTVCYLFATALAEYNEDLLTLALLGAAGDRHFTGLVDGQGLHRILLEKAVETGLIDDNGAFFKKHEGTLNTVASALDALGSFGYFSGGPDIGVKGLLEGFDSRYHIYANQYQVQFDEACEAFINSEPLKKTGRLNSFVLPESFLGFGVKTVGIVAEQFADTSADCKESYLLGFQKIPDQVPGIGDIEIKQIKASMRVGKGLRKSVLDGSAIAVSELIKTAASNEPRIFVDACHTHAGAFTLPAECRESIVQAIASSL